MDHSHADEDLGVIVAALLFADAERPQTPLGGFERIDLGSGSLTDSRDFGSGSVTDGFLRDDELLAIYTATHQVAEAMAARDAELKKSTAALKAIIVQVKQLPFTLGQQTSKYMASGIREVV